MPIRFFLFALFSINGFTQINAQESISNALYREETSKFFNTSGFNFFKDTLVIHIPLKINVSDFTGIILSVESNNPDYINLALECRPDAPKQALFYTKSQIISAPLKGNTNKSLQDTVSIWLTIDFKKDCVTMHLGENRLQVSGLGFNVNSGYKFTLLPQKQPLLNGREIITANTPEVWISHVSKSKYPTWFWYVLIVGVDLLIFLVVQWQRRKNKKTVPVIQNVLPDNSDSSIVLPQKSAIYIFGGFRIYDNNGVDIARQFSPLLKELLALLILTSADKGISSEKLKDILWSDKSEASARNNRAVNFGKLRSLLALVGDFELTGSNGYWHLSLTGIFSDYNEFARLIVQPGLSRENMFQILALTQEGILLKNADYIWLDKYKSKVSDQVIELLSNYARTLESDKEGMLSDKIADAIFANDPMNEYALQLKCKYYTLLGNGFMTKKVYDKFCKEYQILYGESYPHLLDEILSKKQFA